MCETLREPFENLKYKTHPDLFTHCFTPHVAQLFTRFTALFMAFVLFSGCPTFHDKGLLTKETEDW